MTGDSAVVAESPEVAHESLIRFLYQAPIGLVQTTLDGEITMINPMSAQLLMPLAIDGALGNLFDLLAGVAPQLRTLAERTTMAGGVVCEGLRVALAPVKGRGGAPTMLAVKLVRLDAHSLMCTLSDATGDVLREQQQLDVQLHLATHVDKLTGMPNGLALLKRIERELGRIQDDSAHRFGVYLFNADRFDRINVTRGRAIGDAVLRSIAGRLQSLQGACGDHRASEDRRPLTAHLGADEFALVLELPGNADAGPLAAESMLALNRPYLIGDIEVHLSVSAGSVVPSDVSRSADAVFQEAGMAMREAKHAGGARHCAFQASMRERAARRGELEAELRRALSEQQLFVVYQPIVDLDEGGFTSGMEALVRWQHPERGMISPVEFIEIAEEAGLIGALGEWVLREATRQLVTWQRTLGANSPRYMSVNLSRAQLVEPDVVQTVADALAVSGLEARSLQLEVTESLAVQDAAVLRRLFELKSLGVSIALDDFGTGYSSLSSLHSMPIDVVKIDRSFVSQAVTSKYHRVLIEAVTMIARSLDMRTVAEGIETAVQAELMARLHCDKGQGYLYARPMPSRDSTAWLESANRATKPDGAACATPEPAAKA